MSDQTINDLSGIDKFDGSFDKEESGCTIFINETVNLIKDLDAGGLYMYLLCRPPSWRVNIKHLTTIFKCGKNKVYRLIDLLISLKLLSRTEIREKGKFKEYRYRIHLRPVSKQIAQSPPVPQKPEAAKPDTVNEDTYKTNILPLENKEDITTTTEVVVVDINSKTLTENEKTKLTESFSANPFESTHIKTVDDFLSAALHSILNREEHITRRQRLHGIIKLVKQRVFEEPALWATKQKKEQSKKPETREEYNARIARYMEENKRNSSR